MRTWTLTLKKRQQSLFKKIRVSHCDKGNNQDTIKAKKVTHRGEVNQLISKEIEQVQTKGQSSAKVTPFTSGDGDIFHFFGNKRFMCYPQKSLWII